MKIKTSNFSLAPACWLTLILMLARIPALAAAAEMEGAAAVLRKVEEQSAGKPAASSKQNENEKLRQDLGDFRSSAGKLSAEAAARRWLELVDRAAALSARSLRN